MRYARQRHPPVQLFNYIILYKFMIIIPNQPFINISGSSIQFSTPGLPAFQHAASLSMYPNGNHETRAQLPSNFPISGSR